MPNRHATLRWILPLSKVLMIIALIVIALGFILTCTLAVLGAIDRESPVKIAVLGLISLAEISLALTIIIAEGLVRARMASLSAVAAIGGQLTRIQDTLEAEQEQLRKISELSSMSDHARALMFHEQEVEAVQEMVNACIIQQDYERAESIIRRMQALGGYEKEATRLRDAVESNKQANEEGKFTAAAQRIRDIIKSRNWDRTTRELHRLEQAYPGHKLLEDLKTELHDARNAHKSELLQMYDEAVRRKDVDKSIELLQMLDLYLSAPEAAALQESARGVFRAKLHSLGVSFSIAVNEQQWEKAAGIGARIMDEYPNSRMAEEVRQKIDVLRNLAKPVK